MVLLLFSYVYTACILVVVKVRDAIRLIEADGWRLVSQQGSHRQFKHHVKKGRVTVAGHPGVDVPTGTLKNIYRQAQLQEKKG